MGDVSPALIIGCGSALICGILLLLIGMSALRFGARFSFLIPIVGAVVGFFTNRRGESEEDVRIQQYAARPPNQTTLDFRSQQQSLDFDSAVNYYRQQQQGAPYETYNAAQNPPPGTQLQPGQPTQPMSPQGATRPLIPSSPDLNSSALRPGQAGQPNQPVQQRPPGSQPLNPNSAPLRPNVPQTGANTQSLGDDDLERYNLRSRFPNNRPVYGDLRRRQQADENEDFVAGLLGSEEEFYDDNNGDGGLF
jgi:hypothetical protein